MCVVTVFFRFLVVCLLWTSERIWESEAFLTDDIRRMRRTNQVKTLVATLA